MPLNNTQRKVLEKIYINKIDRARNTYTSENPFYQISGKAREEALSAFEQGAVYKSIVKQLKAIQVNVNAFNKSYASVGVVMSDIARNAPNLNVTHGTPLSLDISDITKKRELEYQQKLQAFDDAQSKVSEAIWLYEGVEAELSEQLESIVNTLTKEG